MQPAPEKHSEVVYRRTPEPGTESGGQSRGYAPAIAPLVIGFLLLLALILMLGLKSANKMSDVSSNARILTLGYSTHLTNLLTLRLEAIKLDNEARLRDAAEARHELTPPLDLRLDQARDSVRAVQKLFGPPPIDVEAADWDKFKADLQAYI